MALYQRKFARDHPEAKDNKQFYRSFQKWLTDTYPPEGVPTDVTYERLILDDKEIRYGDNSATWSEEDIINEDINAEEYVPFLPGE